MNDKEKLRMAKNLVVIRILSMKKYQQKPEVKAKMKEYYQRPEVKAKKKKYYQRPEVKARRKKQR